MSQHPHAPPPGGFGQSGPGYPHPGMGPLPTPPGRSTGAIIAIVVAIVVGGMVLIVGVFGVLAVFGTRKYIANAKTAEAMSYLGQMSKDAASAYEREELSGGDAPTGVLRRLCPSAAAPVPRSMESVKGMKYQSATTEWTTDPGFACLRFEVTSPQYYQYNYTSTVDAFTAVAQGDLDGDGIYSRFEVPGKVQNDRLVVTPMVLQTNPEE